jgi:alpha-L-rhamnosidase
MKQFFVFIVVFFIQYSLNAQNLFVQNLQCENRDNPLGVETAKPSLSWKIYSEQKNVLQTAYQIMISDDIDLLYKGMANIWDSKKVLSSASIQVLYSGPKLVSAKKYYWRVKVWDNKNNVSNWSQVFNWQMGLLHKVEWQNAKWIAYDEVIDSLKIAPHIHLNGKKSWGARRNILPQFRKVIEVKKTIKEATAFVCGLGQFDFFINGEKVGDHFLDPGWTNYAKHAQYVTFDISKNIKEGKNAVGAMLGNGFYYIPGQRYRKMTGAYGHPKLIAKIVINYKDGSQDIIITDETWKTTASPIIFSSIFGGEDYDANLFDKNWCNAFYDDKNWKQSIVVNGEETLQSQMQLPIQVQTNFLPIKTTVLKKGVTVYDLGQNFSGIPAIKVSGNKYDTIKMYCGELLNADGTVNQKATGSPSYFTYVLNGEANESWQPQFSYTGFRYVQVQSIAKDTFQTLPTLITVEGKHISSLYNQNGTFTCNNQLFNKTKTLIDWAIKSNTVSLFTDCPHREKLGWLEQTHLMGASIQYNYDIAAINKKTIEDIKNAQYKNGKIPEIAPEFTLFTPPFDESPEWGSASIILPWYNYKWYGDRQTLINAYPTMQRYFDYLLTKDSAFILKHGLGDWFDIGPKKSGFAQMTKMGITATATLYCNATILIEVAKILNYRDDIIRYKVDAAQIKQAFNNTFFNKKTLQYDSASQTANAMALYMGLVEPQYKQAVLDALIKDIQQRNNALTAGDIGYRYVLRALEEAGRSDIIFDMNSRDDVPGYGFQLKHGATALTESWQAYESVSNNHLMLGHLMEWFYSGLVGIQQSKNSVAYKNIIIKPQLVGDITFANAQFNSPYGLIVSSWRKIENKFELNVEVPCNTTAVIYLPATHKSVINQSDISNGKIMSVKKVKPIFENEKAIIKVGSGKYIFKIN